MTQLIQDWCQNVPCTVMYPTNAAFIFEKEISYRCIPHRMLFGADEPFSLLLITNFLHLF